MKESANASVHIHELLPSEEEQLKAVNDNSVLELTSRTYPEAANDNIAMQEIVSVRERLGLNTEVPIIGTEEEAETHEEVPQLGSEEKASAETPIEAVAEQVNAGNAPESQPGAEQAAGGASRNEGGDGGDDSGSKESSKETVGAGTSFFGSIGKGLKYALLAPLWAFGALFALGMNGLIGILAVMEYQVPQFIEVEDKIFGPLTWKQFIYWVGVLASRSSSFCISRSSLPLSLVYR
jgi:hypothetical protein